jgi:hypothetical protein
MATLFEEKSSASQISNLKVSTIQQLTEKGAATAMRRLFKQTLQPCRICQMTLFVVGKVELFDAPQMRRSIVNEAIVVSIRRSEGWYHQWSVWLWQLNEEGAATATKRSKLFKQTLH